MKISPILAGISKHIVYIIYICVCIIDSGGLLVNTDQLLSYIDILKVVSYIMMMSLFLCIDKD